MKRPTDPDAVFALKTAVANVIAHAIAAFTHACVHSFGAWMLGDMANPFALDGGKRRLWRCAPC